MPGGGCLESILAMQLCGNQAIKKSLMRLALVPSNLSIAETFVDLKHGHLWAGEYKDRCICGLSRKLEGLTLVPAMEVHTKSFTSKQLEPVRALPKSQDFIVDCFTMKKDSILLAFETERITRLFFF